MALKNIKPIKLKKNTKFKGNDYEEGFPRMKAAVKGKEKVTKGKWKDYEPGEDEDEE